MYFFCLKTQLKVDRTTEQNERKEINKMENERLLTQEKIHAEMEWARTQLKDIAAKALDAGAFWDAARTIVDFTNNLYTEVSLSKEKE